MSGREGETRRRRLGIAGAAAVVAIPIALVAATWEPLEPPPRAAEPARVNEAATPHSGRDDRANRRDEEEDERPARRSRERERRSTPVATTAP